MNSLAYLYYARITHKLYFCSYVLSVVSYMSLIRPLLCTYVSMYSVYFVCGTEIANRLAFIS